MAKDESVSTIIEAVNARESDPAREKQKILVAGCLSQRFQKDLPGLLPEVDAFIGLDQVHQVVQHVGHLGRLIAQVGIHCIGLARAVAGDHGQS